MQFSLAYQPQSVPANDFAYPLGNEKAAGTLLMACDSTHAIECATVYISDMAF